MNETQSTNRLTPILFLVIMVMAIGYSISIAPDTNNTNDIVDARDDSQATNINQP
jgi:hypothetical protein